ncbi:non-ribosomal peptide synthetase/type I polyketide synthase [Chitinophaga sp. HK235]|uniref:non-ribosomal peptide synthetase/type I polyketide synthase n=1 Tax=Chitinophaga sp. HK235 TaxID=2952571 RepID=UPI001BA47C77|nr:non-ribosomal peptide synthetase/type I polyketide synthase [Chitinophaga sp. HK235]
MNKNQRPSTLPAILAKVKDTHDKGITFITASNKENFLSYHQLYSIAVRWLGLLQDKGLKPGDELVLQVEDYRTFIQIFWACILGGIIPVPVAVTYQGENAQKLLKIRAFLNNPTLCVSSVHYEKITNAAFSDSTDAPRFENVLFIEELERFSGAGTIYPATPENVAFLQFSSGSTGNPKGVVLTHRNLITNIYAATSAHECTENDSYLSWMPLTHDMGLIGFHLFPAGAGVNQYLIPTDLFIRNPLLWMQKVSEHRATVICSPNFGYKYYLNQFTPEKGTGLDLSSVRIILNGAEPVSANLCREFMSTMGGFGLHPQAMCAGYGLAEATLEVTFYGIHQPFNSITVPRDALSIGQPVTGIRSEENIRESVEIVDLGQVIDGVTVEIRNEREKPLKDGHMGVLWIKGDAVTSRYYNNEVATQAVIRKDGWLNTGDTGFMQDGHLFVVGRVKDIIFINGGNVYPHDIEHTLEQLDGMETGKVVACGVPDEDTGSESIVVFVLFKSTVKKFLPVIKEVKRCIGKLGLEVKHVLPVRKIPKTTSGKIKRYLFVEDYRKGLYDKIIREIAQENDRTPAPQVTERTAAPAPPAANPQQAAMLRQWLTQWLQKRFNLSESALSADTPFAEYGMSSLQATALAGDLEEFLQISIDKTIVYSFSTINDLAGYLSGVTRPPVQQNNESATAHTNKKSTDNRIAVVGIGCRFPGGVNTPAAFWDLLSEQRSAITVIPKDRWDADAYFDENEDATGRMYIRHGGFIDQVDGFDPMFFGISPKEAACMDPQQRLLLEVCWESLENAGLSPSKLRGSETGVFIGMGTDDYQQIVHSTTDATYFDDAFSGLGIERSVAAGRIAYLLDFHGPVVQLDTACSSSLLSIHQACQHLMLGECSLALAGGVNLMLSPETTIKLCRMKALSPSGLCKTFDDSADGYVRGEGCGIVVLKRLQDALADGDNVLAVIAGSAVNHDGLSNGLTAPNGIAQQQVIRKALRSARLSADSVQYVEAHGTGTRLGDPVEIQALQAVYGHGRSAAQSLLVGAVKTNIGHLEAAAGIAGFIKTVLSLQHAQLPGSLNCHEPNRLIPWKEMAVKVVNEMTPWTMATDKRRAGVSSFGLSGTNVHIILEEGIAVKAAVSKEQPVLPAYPLLLSAKTPAALKTLVLQYAALPEGSFADIAYTTAVARDSFKYRLAFPVSNEAEMREYLHAAVEDTPVEGLLQGSVMNRSGKIAWLFTGGGSQYWNMGRELYRHNAVFKRIIDHCDVFLQSSLNISLTALLYEMEMEAANELLQKMIYLQPALYAISCALAEMWKSWGISPSIVAGHSLGEYAAAYVAGVFSLDDGLTLVTERARLMQEGEGYGSMATVFAAEVIVAAAIRQYGKDLAIAAVNGPELTVISGKKSAVSAALQSFGKEGINSRELLIAQASHSPLMEPVLEPFYKVANRITYHTPSLQMISNITGKVVTDEVTRASYWCDHIVQPVQFSESIKTIKALDTDILMELGPQPNLLSMVHLTAAYEEDCLLPSMRYGQSSWSIVLKSLMALYINGVSVNWESFYDQPGYHKVLLPVYPFQRQRYWATDNTEKLPVAIVPASSKADDIVGIAAASERNYASILAYISNTLEKSLKIPSGNIDVGANLIQLGADSLILSGLARRIGKRYEITISVRQLFEKQVTLELLAGYIEAEVNVNGEAIQEEQTSVTNTRSPLSFNQERLWFVDQLEGSVQYHIPAVIRFNGTLDRGALQEALKHIVTRHEVLRTVIAYEGDHSYQQVLPASNWQLTIADERLNDPQQLQRFITTFIDSPMDLTRDYMLRAHLIPLAATEHLLVLKIHHFAFDGWSAEMVFLPELITLYNTYAAGRLPQLSPLSMQYADYALWQHNRIAGDKLNSELAYWKKQLEGVTPLQLPADYTRPAAQSSRGAKEIRRLPDGLPERLQALSRQEGATLFMTLLTAFKVLLYRYCGQEDICVSSPIAGRMIAETEAMIGFCVNTLALRTNAGDNPTFVALLQKVKETTLAAYEHQELPFEKVVGAVARNRQQDGKLLEQVIFRLGNMPDVSRFSTEELQLTLEPHEQTTTMADVNFYVLETRDGSLVANVEYSTALFSSETITRMLVHYEQLLLAAVQAPHNNINTLTLLTPGEEYQLLHQFNDTAIAYTSPDKTIIGLFAEQVLTTPEVTALMFEEEMLTYRELDIRSNQLAHYLGKKGVKEGMLIPVCIERSTEMIIAILGIIKAGAAYVPVDPDIPAARIAYILEDIGANIILSSSNCLSKLPDTDKGTHVVILDEVGPFIAAYPQTPFPADIHASHLAYVIYTSGSTGKPKGVMIEHRGVVNLSFSQLDIFQMQTGTRVLQFASVGFDASCYEIFVTLLHGGTLVVPKKEELLSAELFSALVNKYQVEVVTLPPSYLHTVREVLGPVKTIVSAGEALNREDVKHITAKGIRLINAYGPTENTVCTTTTDNPVREDSTVTIGKPIANVQVYVLDANGGLCPIGVKGEICIGGTNLARGYWNLPEQTAAKFILNPYDKNRLYRTGDVGRWQPDGNIEYLGRMDDQVKIRGYRIEPGEITNILQECALVNQALVVANTDTNGHKRLVGYIVSHSTFNAEEITTYLKERLPEYMIPARLIPIAAFPVNANGKIDTKALPDPDAAQVLKNSYVAPRNETEADLANIWLELLGVERVGIHDNFFELGGDSIITIQVVSRARRMGYSLQVGDLFSAPTISQLTQLLRISGNMQATAEQVVRDGKYGLLPIQQWYFEKDTTATIPYNQSLLLAIDKKISSALVSRAIAGLVRYHDALRLVFSHTDHGWEQEYGSYTGTAEVVDLQAVAPEDLADKIKEYGSHYQGSLDIKQGILVKAVLLLTPDSEPHNRLLFVIHHLAVDGVSWRILLEDLVLLLQGEEDKEMLVRKSSAYRQSFEALVQYGQHPRLLRQQPYWEQVTNGYVPLRTDKAYDGKVVMADTDVHTVKLESRYTRQLLQEAPQAYHTEINDILLCALAATLSAWNGAPRISIGLEGHGREDQILGIDTSHTVGWFTSLYPVVLNGNPAGEAGLLLKEVKEQLRQIPDKGIGYGVLKYISKTGLSTGKNPWDVVFNYLGQLDNIISSGDNLSMAAESTGSAIGADYPVEEKLSINSIVKNGELVLEWRYSTHHFESATIGHLANTYLLQLQALIDHCVAQAGLFTVYTPADYGLEGIVSNKELDEFLDTEWKDAPRRPQVAGLYKLSPLQEGMLFHGLYDEGTGSYIAQFSCDLVNLNVEILLQCWKDLLRRHSILRSGFYYNEFNIPVQSVYHEASLPVTILDYSAMSEAAKEAAWNEYQLADQGKGFDFGVPPLMRIGLIKLTDSRYRMLLTFHHIILDGWSLPVLVEELLNSYELLYTGRQLPAASEDSYADYIRYISRVDSEQEESYWRNYLSAVQKGSLLPFIGATTERTKGAGIYKDMPLLLDAETTSRITRYVQRHHITLNTLMQGVWAYLLYRYTGSDDVVYGVTVSGRPEDLPDVEQRVGLYINTLPLYAAITSGSTVKWLQALQEQQLQRWKYQYTALSSIQQWTGIQGEFFDTLLVFENYPVNKVLLSQSWHLQIENTGFHEHTNYPLNIIIVAGEEISVRFNYNAALLEEAYAQEIAGHFEHVLLQLLNNEAGNLEEVELLTPHERQQLLTTFNDTAVAFPQDQTLPALFSLQAARTPDAVAVRLDGAQLSYGELDRQSDQLAQYLASKGVSAETLVPLCITPSFEMLIAILAVWKSGAAYVPVDPVYPIERINYILQDTGAKVVITSKRCKQALPAIDILVLDDADEREKIAAYTTAATSAYPLPENLAYVIYTSGSTGQPKGVMVEHRHLLNYLVNNKTRYINMNEDTGGTFIHLSYCFDAAVTGLFMPLIYGKSIVIGTKQQVEVFEDVALWQYAPYDFIKLTPAHLPLLEEAMKTRPGKYLTQRFVVGGEALDTAHIQFLLDQDREITIINEYGPTEATVGCSTYWFTNRESFTEGSNGISIGQPIDNVQLFVLDMNRKMVPIGVVGEICIGGGGVARGYLNHPELTSEKFISNSFPGTNIYRTGDLGRWLPDGTLEYLGRSDNQVKVHGYRIELGEIESALLASTLVRQAVVLARQNGIDSSNRYLVGYVVPAVHFDREGILSYLKSRLPEYMMPASLVALEEFPLTSHGKIDRKALPDADDTLILTNAYVAPRNKTEHVLVGMWQELLHKPAIGIYDNFFESGGHSLLAMRLVAMIRKRLQVELAVRSLFHYPTIADLAIHLQEMEPALLLPAIEAGQRPAIIPLSYSQERLWFIDQMEGSVQYHLSAALRLTGALDITALSNALRDIVNRHEVLRTVIRQEEGVAYQHILDKDKWQLTVTDLPVYRQSSDALRSYVASLIATPFDLEMDYMLRSHLVVSGENEHVLLIVLHHIACDGWSVSIVVEELIALYEAYTTGSVAVLPDMPIQYADYAVWQRQYLSGKVLTGKLNYWENKLKEVGSLQLPGDGTQPLVQRNKGAGRSFRLNRELTDALQQLSLQQGTTLFMTLLAAFKVLLYRYSGEEDICVGSPIAGRTQEETEGLIGFFVNTLVLRSNLAGEPTFAALLQQLKTTTLEAYEHQDVPFEKVVEAVVKDRDVKGNPLFRVLFSLQNIPPIPALRLGSVQLSPLDIAQVTTQFDITVNIQEDAEGLNGNLIYAVDLFSGEMIDRMLLHFEQLLKAVVKSPGTRISALPMITTGDEQQLAAFNDTTVISLHRDEHTILDVFASQVSEHPLDTAIIGGDAIISYEELNRRSDQLAHYLRSQGVKAETLVPVCMERSAAMLIAIWGIWKAGGAYVPIDPDYPQERISYILSDTAAGIVVSSQACLSKLLDTSGLCLIALDDEAALPDIAAGNEVLETPDSRQLAYIIYTSGSTGRPKGVMIEHGSLLNYLRNNQTAYIDDNSGLTGSFVHFSYTFDASLTAMFMPLLSGKTVVIGNNTGAAVFEDSLFQQYAPYDFIKLTPAHLPLLAMATEKNGGKLFTKRLVVGGEALLPAHLAYFLEHAASVEVINEYGPTEATVGCSTFLLHTGSYTGGNRNGISIGKPIDNVQLYILDAYTNKVPVGVYGEIVIGGAGLARGYLHLPELTKERFILSPFSNDNTTRLYRTGDTGRWLADGTIEYLGRTDDQVKIRGYRVELGEVESVLQEYDTVSQAVVLAKKDSSGSYQLTGYIVPGSGFERAGVFSWLKHRVPEYMVPTQLITVAEVPLTVHGKTDKKALLAMEYEAVAGQTGTGPRSQMEWALTGIWKELLELDQVGIDDNFFEIGGHSLLVIRMISLIRKRLSLEVPIGDVFDYPSISVLAAHLEHLSAGKVLPAIVAAQTRPSYVPLSYSQERLWFIDRLEGSVHYHVPYALHLKGDLNRGALENALRGIIQRHEVLRTVIRQELDNAYQYVMDTAGWQWVIEELPADQDTTTSLHHYIQSLISRPFNLSEDYMLRAHLLVKGASEHILIITMHHIASDGWSAGIIVRELVALYDEYAAGVTASLPAMDIQYADYVLWQRQYLSGDVLTDKLSYWKSQLEGVDRLQLPVDYKHLAAKRTQGASREFKLDTGLSEQLQLLSRQQGVTLYMTLLAAFKVLLYRYTGQEDICVGSAVAGRSRQEVEGLVGFFVNMLALRSDLRDNPSFVALLQQVKVTTLNAYTHQDVPFEKVVDAVVKERNMSTTPLFQVLFSLQNIPEIPALRLGNTQLEYIIIEDTTTQFDITIAIQETVDGLSGTVTYSTGLFREDTIIRMLHHYEQLLQSIITTPEAPIGTLSMLGINEAAQLMEVSGALPADNPHYTNETFINLFEQHVLHTPDAIALRLENKTMTYRELDEQTSQLARYLAGKGVGAETLVPLCITPSFEMLIAILAVWKSGAAYVPMDPLYPTERVTYILQDTGAKVVITNKSSKPALPAIDIIVLDDEDEREKIAACTTTRPAYPLPENLAYVIYTSGSTGKPKGVMIEHRHLLNFLLNNKTCCIDVNEDTAGTFVHLSYCFDGAVTGLFMPLVYGKSIVIGTRQQAEVFEDAALWQYAPYDFIKLTPAHLPLLQEAMKARPGKYLTGRYIVGGEALDAAHLQFLLDLDREITLINMYGPTEATVACSAYWFNNRESFTEGNSSISIGRPLDNVQLYVLDMNQEMVPIGVIGEICIGGSGVARGYLNRPELTAEKFISNAFSDTNIYRTGDLGRWLPDGMLEYLGRSDNQVKVHGYRIELGEIESALLASSLVRQAVVLARQDSADSSNRYLVGYVVPVGHFDRDGILSYLKSRLPEYMIPTSLVALEEFPLTAHGKIDKKALLDPHKEPLLTGNHVGPRNELEQQLVNIWEELLETSPIGIYDDFFDLGGHSILSIRLVTRIRETLQVEMSMGTFFELPTIEGLSRYISVNQSDNLSEDDGFKTIQL